MNTQYVKNREMFSIARDILLEGSSVKVSVKGQSMLPFFRSGATVLLRPIRESDFRKYNVVMADAGRNFVIHRIIALDGEKVTLLGDGNIYGTETMSRDKVYGIIDCSRTHPFLAKLWLLIRPLRKYPLWIIRRITSK